jgi:hypothetical protein
VSFTRAQSVRWTKFHREIDVSIGRSNDDQWNDYVTCMPLARGFRFGLLFAAGISSVAVVRIAFAMLLRTLYGRMSVDDFGSAARLLMWVVPGYFAGFALAGVFYAVASHVSIRVLRYTLVGFLCGTSIYGAVGISSNFLDGKPLNAAEIASTAGGLGLLFGFLGLVMGALDTWRERRRA